MQSHILPFENIQQKNEMACWLAASQQIIQYCTSTDISQKELLAKIDNIKQEDVTYSRGGTFDEIGDLLKLYNVTTQGVRPNMPQLENWVRDHCPVILQFKTHLTSSHAVILRGLVDDYWILNDPLLSDGFSVMIKPAEVIKASTAENALVCII